jgi:hypothetical protein
MKYVHPDSEFKITSSPGISGFCVEILVKDIGGFDIGFNDPPPI